ncbi:hypothetical protein LshimejAT787_1103030 [Lyophyllum shimeji]|uniref:Uncharacterized protein n=1 Tax=Lyophyllum shimeji TaxID=47721 RepID=A0A9P3PVE1_LYOSH|nr:hypothetical protein LshimejAT787_1103030 [Lyophyllum shimeji]
MVACPSQRPTLPPLHTLGLPNPSVRMTDAPHELSYDDLSCPRLHIPQWRHARQVSASSSMTSRSPSPPIFDSSSSCASSPPTEPEDELPTTPVLSISPLSSRLPHSTSLHNTTPLRFRLEPCTLDEAQAIVLIPPPSAPFVPSTSNPTPTPQQKQQALLLIGPSLQYFRHPQRQLAKGARIHPYRIAPSRRKDGVWSRRSSGSSTP